MYRLLLACEPPVFISSAENQCLAAFCTGDRSCRRICGARMESAGGGLTASALGETAVGQLRAVSTHERPSGAHVFLSNVSDALAPLEIPEEWSKKVCVAP